MIEVNNLTRCYGDFVAVDKVSFRIGAGEIVGLLGHNGAGKSTIMKMLTGFLEPNEGEILIGGCNVRGGWGRAQARIGYLPENCPVYPEMSVIDFLDYSAALRGMEGRDKGEAILGVLHQTELEERAADRIATLSKGFRQRVGVARALLQKPEILILDEPTSGLDPSQIEHMRALIRRLGESVTVIVSTHILQEVEAICDRVLILRHGHLAVDARLDEMTRSRGLILRCCAEAADVVRELMQIDGVVSVDRLPDAGPGNGFRLQGKLSHETFAAQVAAAVVGRGWALYQLHSEERTLEKVFHELSAAAEEVSDAA
jgi:ABC-2 type transport system ATP-binding protein